MEKAFFWDKVAKMGYQATQIFSDAKGIKYIQPVLLKWSWEKGIFMFIRKTEHVQIWILNNVNLEYLLKYRWVLPLWSLCCLNNYETQLWSALKAVLANEVHSLLRLLNANESATNNMRPDFLKSLPLLFLIL